MEAMTYIPLLLWGSKSRAIWRWHVNCYSFVQWQKTPQSWSFGRSWQLWTLCYPLQTTLITWWLLFRIIAVEFYA